MARRGSELGWLLAAAGLALLLSEPRPPHRNVRPRGPQRDPQRAPERERCEWVRAKLALLGELLTGRPALLLVAHWRRETGGEELNWNVGNIRAFASTDLPWFYHPRNGLPFRAYDDEAAGVRAGLDLLRNNSRYADAWRKLQAGDVTWYETLGRAGYYEQSARESFADHQQDYERILALVEACAP